MTPQFGFTVVSEGGSSPSLNSLLEEVVANVTTSRQEWLANLMDPRRNIDDECGYPRDTEVMGAEIFRRLYDRDAVSNRVISVLPKESWQGSPTVYEDEDSEEPTEFEDAWDQLEVNTALGSSWHQEEKGGTVWETLLRADILSGIGHFGVILLGIDDGKNLSEPIDGVSDVLVNKLSHTHLANGHKRITVNRATVFHNCQDSYLHPNEQGNLESGKSFERRTTVYNKESREWETRVVPGAPMNEEERATVQGWISQRSIGEARVWERQVRNAQMKANAYREGPRDAERDSGQHINPREPSRRGNTVPGGSVADMSGLPFGTSGAPSAGQFLSGTDKSYDGATKSQDSTPLGGMNTTQSGLSGTDQQYFGVQFGPSETPAKKPGKARRKLLFLRAYSEDLVQIVRYEWNVRNPRFGMPVMYRITLNDPREQHSGVGLPMATVFVHWSRVIHLADTFQNTGSSEIFAPPRLRPVYNRIYDLMKVYGSAGEGYWKSCFAGLVFETHPQLGGDVKIKSSDVKDTVEQFWNGLQRVLIGKGGSWKTLPPQVVDPTPYVAMLLEAICIQLACPVRVFKGSERGELASSQDDDNWNDRKRERQAKYITPKVIVPFIDRLIQIGVLPEPKGPKSVKAQGTQPQAGTIQSRSSANGLGTKGNGRPNIGTPHVASKGNGQQTQRQGKNGTSASAKDNSLGTGAAPPAYKKQGTTNRLGYNFKPPQSDDEEESDDTESDAPNGVGEADAQGAKGDDGPFGKSGAEDAPDGERGSGGSSGSDGEQDSERGGGYSIEWPDPSSLSEADKAAVALQKTQALAAYIQGGIEALMPPLDYLVHIMKFTDEEAESIINGAKEAHANLDVMTTPPMIEGQQAEAPKGTQAKADSDQQSEMADKQMDQQGKLADAQSKATEAHGQAALKHGPLGGAGAVHIQAPQVPGVGPAGAGAQPPGGPQGPGGKGGPPNQQPGKKPPSTPK